jgi:hypothetical protein
MIPGKLYKAAIAAAMTAFALTLPVSGAEAQQHGTKRWQYQTHQQYRTAVERAAACAAAKALDLALNAV